MDQQLLQVPPQPAHALPNSKRKLLALWLLIGPTALTLGCVLLFALVNFIGGVVAPAPTAYAPESFSFGAPNAIGAIINVLLFCIGGIASVTFLPGLIIGTILLMTQKKA